MTFYGNHMKRSKAETRNSFLSFPGFKLALVAKEELKFLLLAQMLTKLFLFVQ